MLKEERKSGGGKADWRDILAGMKQSESADPNGIRPEEGAEGDEPNRSHSIKSAEGDGSEEKCESPANGESGARRAQGSGASGSEQQGSEKAKKPQVTLFYERKGRAGKEATILADFVGLNDDEIAVLASEIKRKLGTGGSVRGGEILIQGDRRKEIREMLTQRGFMVEPALK